MLGYYQISNGFCLCFIVPIFTAAVSRDKYYKFQLKKAYLRPNTRFPTIACFLLITILYKGKYL